MWFCPMSGFIVLADSDQADSENPDVELVWNLQLLSNVKKKLIKILPYLQDWCMVYTAASLPSIRFCCVMDTLFPSTVTN